MSKEKINPGEECPFCLTTTARGSVVCSACGAARQYDVYGFVGGLIKLAGVVAVICLLVGAFAIFFSDNKILPFLIMVVPLIIVTLLRRKFGTYGWVRHMP
ncbi:hypothetical protein SAMN02745728_01538 [Desulfovibrio litoralis DSM 11393]|uniref:Uncharacterized protein n=2 Tax=Desulfovibrio litoralis TaxID=466107 RepID=A0A1M7T473_9BACT|nr:hypothetical protein SAMN02745728_01538 [Desulfovibrio litoralis DSM 11393]